MFEGSTLAGDREREPGERSLIPQADILAWRASHPWLTNAQVEQDLIISRAMVELFTTTSLQSALAMRGGTAIHKLYLAPATRYSEDIDLVQMQPGSIGPLLDEIRATLDSWLGKPQREQNANDVKLIYRIHSEIAPVVNLRVKIEINTREHEAVEGTVRKPFLVASRWFSNEAAITTFSINELLGTKMRALYQRRKGRDLYDLWHALATNTVDPSQVIRCFRKYTGDTNPPLTRDVFTRNLEEKLSNAGFLSDMAPLLRPGLNYDPSEAYRLVNEQLLARM